MKIYTINKKQRLKRNFIWILLNINFTFENVTEMKK